MKGCKIEIDEKNLEVDAIPISPSLKASETEELIIWIKKMNIFTIFHIIFKKISSFSKWLKNECEENPFGNKEGEMGEKKYWKKQVN